ncbi:hypothetical protein SLS62_001599 [Diatrype stigma]|uniref:Mannosyl-3-phosphoglycerate synthase n=1 Tax=Diatrype stigma TaxID=117547 RepID=A0AAN9UXW1_9PEZI
MRIEGSIHKEQFGNVQINELQRVIELDAGHRRRRGGGGGSSSSSSRNGNGDIVVPSGELATAEENMGVVIACMNEELDTIQGVLAGVPHDCLAILVSNSDRPNVPGRSTAITVDRFKEEVRLIKEFSQLANRSVIAVHQADPGVAKAFRAAGMPEMVDDRTGLIHRGKGEAMIIGMVIAALKRRKYVGFIDADNFVPGSVTEYCKVFAAALHSAHSPLAMVRVSWNSKPKVRDGRLVFDKKGRSSIVVNDWLNKLLQEYLGYNTGLIVTGNAGEHAMTMELGLQLRLARGYAIEPYELINILEMFGADASVPALDHDSGFESESDYDVDVITPPMSLSSSPLLSASPSPSLSLSPSRQAINTSTHHRHLNLPQLPHRMSPSPRLLSPSPSLSPRSPSSSSSLVEILQVETRNPHFHDTTKGEEHVADMQLQGLKALYHSDLTTPALREQLRAHMTEALGLKLAPGEDVPRERTYPPLRDALDFDVFRDVLTNKNDSSGGALSLHCIGFDAQLDDLLPDRNAAFLSGGGRGSTGAGADAGVVGLGITGVATATPTPAVTITPTANTNPAATSINSSYRRLHRQYKKAPRGLRLRGDDDDDDDDHHHHHDHGSRRSSTDRWSTAVME